MILCDTNILIEFFKSNQAIVDEMRHLGAKNVAVSHITLGELFYGALDKVELKRIQRQLTPLTHFPIDASISGLFILLMEQYSLSHKLSIPDALIAATAISHNLELYTLNQKDFNFITDLELYQPAINQK